MTDATDPDSPDADTQEVIPPAWGLVLLALEGAEGWQSRQDIEDHIESEIGYEISTSTLQHALRKVRDWDDAIVRWRTTDSNTVAREYRRD